MRYYIKEMINETQYDIAKCLKVTDIALHYYLHHDKADYLLLLARKGEIMVYALGQDYFNLQAKFQVPFCHPLLFFSGALADVHLLHQTGLYSWTVNQMLTSCQPQKVKMGFKQPPRTAFPARSTELAVVCEGNAIWLYNTERETIEVIQCHEELATERLLFDYSNELDNNLYTLIPSRRPIVPFLFNCSDVRQWNEPTFFQNHLDFCRQYYDSDDRLASANYMLRYSAKKQLVYLFFCDSILILEGRKVNEGRMVLKVRLGFKLRTSLNYLFFNVNAENTRIVYGSAERVGQIAPFDYYYLPKSIKQKS